MIVNSTITRSARVRDFIVNKDDLLLGQYTVYELRTELLYSTESHTGTIELALLP